MSILTNKGEQRCQSSINPALRDTANTNTARYNFQFSVPVSNKELANADADMIMIAVTMFFKRFIIKLSPTCICPHRKNQG